MFAAAVPTIRLNDGSEVNWPVFFFLKSTVLYCYIDSGPRIRLRLQVQAEGTHFFFSPFVPDI